MRDISSATIFSNRSSIFLFICLFASMSVAAPAFAADTLPALRLEDYLKRLEYDSVPFETSARGYYLVSSSLSNGKKPTFAVDTGWLITTLSPKSSAGLKSPNERGVVLEDSLLGEVTNSSFVIMDQLGLGDARFLNQPARVEKLDLSFVRAPCDAMLGLDFLLRNFCLIDCGERRLYFRAGAPSDDLHNSVAETLRSSGFIAIPIHAGQGMFIEAQVNDQPVRLLVDSGSKFSMLDGTQVSRLGLKFAKRQQPRTGTLIPDDVEGITVGVGAIGAHETRVTTIKLQIGSRTWNAAHFGVVDLRAWGLGTTLRGVQGMFGRELLTQTGALIDPAGRKLWLRPEGAPR